MSLVLRTIKIVLSTWLSIQLAHITGLQFPFSAGIIAILSVLDTRKASFLVAGKRIISAVIALAVASLLFEQLGFSLPIFALYLVIYVPLAYLIHLEDGIVFSTVLVTHLLGEKNITPALLANEMLLLLFGIGVALLFNLYMPSKSKEIHELQHKADELMKQILLSFSAILADGSDENTNSLLTRLEEALERARQLVYIESGNRLWTYSKYDLDYIEMRKSQTTLLRYMADNLQLLSFPVYENKILAGLFYLSGTLLTEFNAVEVMLNDIERLFQKFRQTELPKSRIEFENRAVGFQMLNDFTHFTEIKRDFYEQHRKEIQKKRLPFSTSLLPKVNKK